VQECGLDAVEIVVVAGDGQTPWRPPPDDPVARCVVCDAPMLEAGVCRACRHRLEGLPLIAARR
jgi:hypothetical protein